MSDQLIHLQEKITFLEQHISEQDTEVYRLSLRVDKLQKEIETQKVQIQSLSSSGGGGAASPADERPPHY